MVKVIEIIKVRITEERIRARVKLMVMDRVWVKVKIRCGICL